jgi:hypothetical protein
MYASRSDLTLDFETLIAAFEMAGPTEFLSISVTLGAETGSSMGLAY